MRRPTKTPPPAEPPTLENRIARLEAMHPGGDCRALCRRAFWLALVTACVVTLREAAPWVLRLIGAVS